MKKNERKLLTDKLKVSVNKVLKANHTELNRKIEKLIGKSLKKIVKKSKRVQSEELAVA